jgi:signal transduction histidine kinase
VYKKLSYDELENRVKELEARALGQKGIEAVLLEFETKWRSLMEEQTAKLKQETAERRRAEEKIAELKRELERRRARKTAELEKTLEDLKKLDAMKDSFLSSVSHEFRAPLTSIRSFSEILLQYEEEDPEMQREFLHIINAESERLSRLVNDLLDLSQIEAGRMVYRDAAMSLEEAIRETGRIQFPSLCQKSLRLLLELPPDLPYVMADPDRTKQVIANLLHNAIGFSSHGGEISISAEALEGEGADHPHGSILVRVSDQGVGIDEKDFAAIFEKFNPGSADTLREKRKGAGLGLPICKEIITHYGGRIWVESKRNQGTTFFFTLPAADPASQQALDDLPSETVLPL